MLTYVVYHDICCVSLHMLTVSSKDRGTAERTDRGVGICACAARQSDHTRGGDGGRERGTGEEHRGTRRTTHLGNLECVQTLFLMGHLCCVFDVSVTHTKVNGEFLSSSRLLKALYALQTCLI